MPLVQGGVTDLGQQKVAEMGEKVLNLITELLHFFRRITVQGNCREYFV